MNASQKTSFAWYIAEAAKVDASKTVAQLRTALRSMGYSANELTDPVVVTAEAKATRRALLHRARAVKATAKARAAA